MLTMALTDICHPKQWRTISAKDLLPEGYPVFGANGIIGYWSEYNHESETITIACRGTCGSVHIADAKSYINGNAMCLDDLSDMVVLKYLYYYLKGYDFSDVISGTTIPQITIEGLRKVTVRVDPHNPNALPIAIQNIKRKLSSIPDQFNNDVLSANTRLEQKRLDLPIGDFLVDLFALGIENTGILNGNIMLTAQQTWPFVVAAYSTAGTPWPCWGIIKKCNEIEKLISILKSINDIGNGYYKRRVETVISLLNSYKNGTVLSLQSKHDKVFDEAKVFVERQNRPLNNPFSPQFIKSISLTERSSVILQSYLSNKLTAGEAIENILSEKMQQDDKRIVVALMRLCVCYDQRNGLIAILRSDEMNTYHSEARKKMFYVDMLYSEVLFSNE